MMGMNGRLFRFVGFVFLYLCMAGCAATSEEMHQKGIEKATSDVEAAASQEQTALAKAKRQMMHALSRHGVDEQYYAEALFITDEISEADPNWFQRTPHNYQFDTIAKMVQERVSKGRARTSYP